MKAILGSSLVVTLILGCPLFMAPMEDSDTRQKKQKTAERREKKVTQQDKRKVDRWMKAKRDYSHQIFDGLIAGDFKKIEEASVKMMGNNFLESWLADRKQYKQDFAYHGELNAFEYSTKELWRFAKQKDIDGALRSYGVMSRSCVRCHHLIRDGVIAPDKVKDVARNSLFSPSPASGS